MNCFFRLRIDGGSPDTTDSSTVAFLDLTLLLGSSFVCFTGQKDRKILSAVIRATRDFPTQVFRKCLAIKSFV